MKAKLTLSLILLLACTSFYAFNTANDPFEDLLKKLTTYNDDHPQEKVHLHLDKPYYAIGDNIWLKAYVTDGNTGKLSAISSAIFVELINETDSVTRQIKLPLTSGLGWGDFELADSLPEGNYRIRAYTQLMMNAGPEFFFDKTIQIGNAWTNKVFVSTTYSFDKKDNEEQVGALLKFTNKQGTPYIMQPVTYQILLDNKPNFRGKGTTNIDGQLNISFIPKTALPASGTIVASITLPNKTVVTKSIPLKTTSTTLSVQLFPEGGNMVNGIPSKVAVKVVNAAGLGENVTGTLTDNDGLEVLTFATTHFGMGNFIINPQPGKIYTARIKLKDGSLKTVTLPKALPAGYVLSINNADSMKVTAKVFISDTLLNAGEMKLVIQSGNSIYTVLKSQAQKQVSSFSIPKKDLPSGILHFTLFTPENLPVCERVVFINNPANFINTSLTGLKSTYDKRENMLLNLVATDNGKPTLGSFSVAVTNSDVVTPELDKETNILTSLLLSSNLKGYIEKPNYYFNENSAEKIENLDNLMLTQGWSRFKWPDIMGYVSKAPVYPAEITQKVSGTLTTPGGKPVEKANVSLVSMSNGLMKLDTLSDAKGHFSFDNLDFGDSTKFVIKARTAKNGKNIEINMDVVPEQVVTKNKNTGDIEVNVNEAIQGYIKKSESYLNAMGKLGFDKGNLLDEVNIVKQKASKKPSWNKNGDGKADYIITAKELTKVVSLADYLQRKVPSVIIIDRKIYQISKSSAKGKDTTMQVLVNGQDMGADFFDLLSPKDIDKIEVLSSPATLAVYGDPNGPGMLIITTKKNGLTYGRKTPGIEGYSPKGYYAVRDFYSPQYIPGNTIKGEDRRTTVFWAPHLLTTDNGTAKLSFYNNDQPGNYRIVIEGINDAGHLARKVYTYQVK